LRDLENTLQNRKEKEIKDINTVLDELTKSIHVELEKENEKQIELDLRGTEDERTQIRRDFDALRARLARIPGEREQEIKTIEHRYADYVARTFPVAVIFLVPNSTVGREAGADG
jgi:septal ring factor EnvC (AmiA/AmiB activator)